MTDGELSDGVVAYLRWEDSSFPRADGDAVRASAGSATDDLLARVQELVSESMAISVDWKTTSLAEASDRVEAVMAERHPELTDTAVKALAWNFAFQWR